MSSSVSAEKMPDIECRDDIAKVVDAFYAKVQEDDLLGFIFNDIAETNWDTHLPKMYDFWETMVLQGKNYMGNPLRPHLEVSEKTTMGPEQFDRWKSLFFATVDDRFAGERAEHMKNAAADMARVMLGRITGELRW